MENTGLGTLYGAVLTDTIGAGYTGFSITPAPSPIDLAAGAKFDYTAQATINSCSNLTNRADAAWILGNADGTATTANTVNETADVLLQIDDPNIIVDIGPLPTAAYCGSLNATIPVTVTNTGGAARNVFLTMASSGPSGTSVSVNPASAAAWNQSGNTLTYTPGTVVAGASVNFLVDVSTGNLCSAASLSLTLTPTYEDSCLLLQSTGTPDTETVVLPLEAPTLSVSKDGPTTMVAGNSYQYVITVSGDNRQSIGPGGVAITDVVPSNLIIDSVSSSGGSSVTQNGQTLRWDLDTSGTGAYSEQFFIDVTVPGQGSGACGAGSSLDNIVNAVADISCPECALSASANKESFIYDFLDPALNTFTKEATPIELCGPPSANVITATLQVGSGITWTNTIYTDTLGAGNLGQAFTIVPGSVKVTVDGTDRTANVAISEGPPLSIDFGGLSAILGAFSATANIVIVYQIDAQPGTISGGADNTVPTLFSQFQLNGPARACDGGITGYVAIPVDVSRGSLGVAVAPDTIQACRENTVTLTVNENTASDITDSIVVSFTTDASDIITPTAFTVGGGFTGQTPTVAQGTQADGRKVVTFTFPAAFDLTGTGTISFPLYRPCGTTAALTGNVAYLDRCDVPRSSNTTGGTATAASNLTLFTTPNQFTVVEKEAQWSFIVSNGGNTSATDFTVANELPFGTEFYTYTLSGSAPQSVKDSVTYETGILAGGRSVVTFTVPAGPGLPNGNRLTFDIEALVNGCSLPDDVTIRLNRSCGNVAGVCQGSSVGTVQLLPGASSLLSANNQTANLPLCETGNVQLRVKNTSGRAVEYNLTITDTITNAVFVAGTTRVSVVDSAGAPIVGTTSGQTLTNIPFAPDITTSGATSTLVWRVTDFVSGTAAYDVLAQRNAKDEIRIDFDVTTGCDGAEVVVRSAGSALDACGTPLSFTENSKSLLTDSPQLEITKQVRNATTGGALGGETSTAPIFAGVGDQLVWNVTVKNTGAQRVTNLFTEDQLPSNFTIDSISPTPSSNTGSPPFLQWHGGGGQTLAANGGSITYAITGTLAAGACAFSPLENQASSRFACSAGDICFSNGVTTTAYISTRPNFTLSASNATIQECEGGPLTVAINNTGARASNVVVTYTLPANMAYAGLDGASNPTPTSQPAVGATGVITFGYASFPGETNGSLQFNVTNATGLCPAPGANTGTADMRYQNTCSTDFDDVAAANATITVRRPNLSTATVTPVQQVVTAGQRYSWSISVPNTGSGIARNLVITETLDPGWGSLQAANGAPGGTVPTINQANRTIVWNVGTLNNGQTWTATFSAEAQDAQPAYRTTLDVTTACDNGGCPQTAQAVTYSTPTQGLDKQIFGSPVRIGQPFTYTINFDFFGGRTYNSAVLTDTLPKLDGALVFSTTGVTIVNENSGGNSWAVGSLTGDQLIFTTAGPPAGDVIGPDSVAITVTGLISNALTADNNDIFTNRADLTWTDDGRSYSLNDSVDGQIVEPILVITKQATPDKDLQAGDEITYTLRVTNTAPSTATAFDVDLTDAIPNFLTYSRGFSAPGATSSGASSQLITATYDQIPLGQSVSLSYVVVVLGGAPVGRDLINTAVISHTSMPGDNPSERTGDPADPGGTANDHNTSTTEGITVAPLEVTKSLLTTNQPHTSGLNVAVGEQITYTLLVTVPQGLVSTGVMTDVLDDGLAFVACDSIAASPGIGTDLAGGFAAACSSPTVTNSGRRAVFDFGTVTNTDTNAATVETLLITYRAVLLNTSATNRGTTWNNSATFGWVDGTSTSSAPDVTVVEPSLAITKTLTPATTQANQTVTVTLEIAHTSASNADAMTVVITDALPAGLTFAGGIANVSGAPFTSGTESGGTITFGWDTLPLGQRSVVRFLATVDQTVVPNTTIVNDAFLAWSSLPGDVTTDQSPYNATSTERTGDTTNPGNTSNDHRAQDDDDLSFTTVGFDKSLTTTNQPHTSGLNVAIGEQITYTIHITVPQGTIPSAVVTDVLDTGLAFIALDSVTASTGVTWNGAGTAAFANSGERMVVDFGTITNANADSATTEVITLVYRAVVLNTTGNNRGDTRNNQADFTWSAGSLSDTTPDVTIVEPDLTIAKSVVPTSGDAGDVFTFTLAITHTAGSDTDAMTVVITDAVPAGMTYVAGSAQDVSGTATTSASESGGIVTFAWDTLALGTGSTVSFRATLDQSTPPLSIFTNTAFLRWSSLPGDVTTPQSGENGLSTERTGNTADPGGAVNDHRAPDNTSLATPGYSIAKALDTTSAGHTAGANVTIGEIITYALTITLPEGTTTDLVVVDNLPAGLAFVSGSVSVDTTGFNGSVAVPAAASTGGSGDDVTLTFAPVTVTGDNVTTNNSFVVRLRALVLDIAANAGLVPPGQTVLTNSATAQVGSTPIQQTAPVTVTVVEPRMEIVKTLTPNLAAANDTVTITLVVSNTGTSEAFEVVVDDPLPDAKFTGAAAVTTPAGFAFSTVASAPNTIVRYTGGSIPVGERRTFVFSAQLTNGVVKGEVLTNVATVTQATTLPGTDAGERDEPDVSDSAPLTISAPDLTLTKTNNLTSLLPGQTTVYSLTVTNVGDRTATGVVLTDTVPISTTFDLANSSTGWSCADNAAAGTICTFPVGTLAVNAGQTVRFAVTLDLPLLTSTAQITNTASTGDDGTNGPDPTPGNNTASDIDPTVLSSLGDYVWLDVNYDGQQGNPATETPVAGVVVNLYDSNGVLIATTTTDNSGFYNFGGLGPGDYTVEFIPPAGYALTTQTVGATATDSNADPTTGRSAPVTLGAGEHNPTIDAGLITLVNLGDYVWLDTDGDGQQGTPAVEPPVAGVTVTLTLPSGTVLTTTTDASGLYTFTNLLPNETYTVTFTSPPGYDFTDQNSGADGTDSDADPTTGVVVVDLGLNDNPTIDAGLVQPMNLGDYVWFDTDADGQQDAGEPGIAGATVALFLADGVTPATDLNGNPVTAQTTGPDGLYNFTNLAPGGYVVQVTMPAGYEPTPVQVADPNTDNNTDSNIASSSANIHSSGVVTLTVGGEPGVGVDSDGTNGNLSVDFGFTGVNLGDYVWFDTNYDGQQGTPALEPVAVGVTVTLTYPNGTVLTTTTDASGLYSFTNLIPNQTYTVTFTPPPGHALTTQNSGADASDSDANPATGVVVVDLGTTDDPTIDAGLVELVNLGDYVWLDTDGDGQQGTPAVEPPVAGVTVTLTLPSGTVITTTTDASGLYTFTNLLPNETYTVTFTSPPGYDFTDQNSGADGTDSDADPTTGQVVVDLGLNDNPTIDAGLVQTQNLGDYVWFDTDADGQQDGGESGIPGAVVTLFLADGVTPAVDQDGNPVAAQTTGPDGLYNFTNLAPGGYVVQVTMPAGYEPTPVQVADANTDSNTDSNIASSSANIHSSSVVTLTVGGEPGVGIDSDGTNGNLSVDFGFTGVNLGDYVWFDTNYDGQQGTPALEPVAAGVTVTLTYPNGTVLTTTTDASGLYSFTNLIPNQTYTVTFTSPPGYALTTQNSGADASDSDANPTTGQVVVDLGTTDDPTIDAGLVELVNLGDYVWLDTDGDGQQGTPAVEPPVAGVTVTLTYPNGTVITTTTDASGLYTFTNLLPNETYTVTFTSPPGYGFTAPNSGADASDSDANQTTGVVVVDLGLNDDPSIDAGLVQTQNLGDYVWFDADADGQQDAGESGIPGAVVTLFLADGVTPAVDQDGNPVAAQTTGPDGLYNFTNLAPGGYVVQVTMPAGYEPTPVQVADPNTDNNTDSNIASSSANIHSSGVVTLTVGGEPGVGVDTDGTNGNLSVDFGFIGVNLGDYVWLDVNHDGQQGDPAVELPVAGVTVTLTYPNGTVLTTTTDASGLYSFTNLIPNQTYTVTFAPPPQYTITTQNSGADGSDSDADPATGVVVVDLGITDDPTIDAGLYVPLKIGDTIWIDYDADGTDDPAEPGLPNVTVNLLDGNGNVISTTVTGPDGTYLFPDLPPGTYTVEVDQTTLPPGFTNTHDLDGNHDSSSTVTQPSGQDNLDLDFGYVGVPVLLTTKRDTHFTDVDNDGVPSPGDVLLYTILISNTGTGPLTSIVFTDTPGVNTTLVVPSVQTSLGTVITGNGAGHTSVRVNVGTLPGKTQATITFRVTINNPLPAGVTQVANQGTVSSGELPTTPTDDPDTTTGGDPTVTPVNAAAAPQITKASSLARDADGNGVVSPGDTLRYNMRMVNLGNATTANVIFSDTPDANTTLVVGSVLSNKGTVTTGNTVGDTTVAIAVGDVNPGDVVLISFDVTVNVGLTTGTVLSNQGEIAFDSDGDGTNDSTRPTDGDTTQPGDQPTTNVIGGSPEGVAIKSVSDVNGGNLEPGDILLYTIVLQNTSSFNAPGLVFEDPIPAHTVYLAGSVSAPGASTVVSTTPTLRITGIDVAAHSQVLITFRVQVINPLPAGVTEISNQGTVFFDSDGDGINDSSQPTDGDTVNPGNQPTVIPVTAGPNYGETTKTVALTNDADGNGVVTPGDTLRYTVRIPNTGNQDSLGAVFLLDTIPANTTYVGGSAVADRGTASFNAGSNRVEWNGDVPAGTTVTITFDVTVNTGIVTGIVISNQGAVRYDTDNDGTPDATELTDSDTTDPGEQPTTVPVGGSPEGVARKTATDLNGGKLEPGDLLLYTVVLQNSSGFNVPGIEFIDNIPAHTEYITNSLTVPAGATIVTQSPVIRVSGVDVAAFSQVTITFRVQITSPLPAGVTQIANQGTVFYDSDGDGINDSSQPTDGDPGTPGDQPTISPVDATLEYSATKRDRLFTDADSNGTPSPGDTIEYEIVVSNTGNQAVTNVVFADTPDANTALVVGSVQTSAGTITAGNGAGNTSVSVDIGTLNGGTSVTISFRVTINAPLPSGVTQVANQGTLSSTELPTVITDDPDTPANEDPTVTPVVAAPVLAASKRDSLAVDADSNGTPSPGDTIEYAITIQNTGNQAATGLVFNDTPDANSALVVGSVTTSAGTVTTGNNGGDTTVAVNIGSLNGGAGVTITFRVTINNPVPAGVTQIANQGSLSSNELPTEQTDDPDTAAGGDPTVTPISAQPVVSATKVDSLAVDADGNGSTSPGDTIEYRITIANGGNQSGRATFIDNVLDPNVALVVGSVQTTLGTIARGNNPGDTGVQVNVGLIPGGGGTVVISFRVTVKNPLPAGVTQVGNQATVSGSNFPTVPTDDPDTPANGDPTLTPVVSAPVLTASKRDTLVIDADSNGSASPGDTLEYQVTIQNTGNSAATSVVFNDIPGSNTALVVGSVQTSAGTVTTGNTAGNTSVAVNIGTLPGGGQAIVTFRVTIDDPLPAGVTRVLNQGTVSSDQLPSVPTDDPDTATSGDATATPVAAAPVLAATKVDSLLVDADSNGIASPGDTILYQITLQNSGNQAATGVVFNDTPDGNTSLIVGSVQANAGTVTTGNGAGHTTVSVNIGTLPGGSSVTITFRVTIHDPLPAGVTQIANQGTLTSNELPTLPTDDPDTGAGGDPTITPLTAAPILDATKQDSLAVDADGNGIPSPGDTLEYRVVIHNSGNQAATGVLFDDTPGANTSLVVGSVQTSAGTVTAGNSAGNTTVSVNIGTIPGGGQVVITFRVTINNPLPAGVTRVVNQGTIHSNELPSLPTDDPDTAQADDPTATPLTAAPIIDATKRDSLAVDADGNGQPSPGDTIEYQIVVANNGNQAGIAAFVNDLLDPNVALVVGSVQTSQGTIVRGNTAGDTSVNVSLGTIPGGQSTTITFRVTVNTPLPAGVTQVANQAIVTGDNFPDVPTDDPDTPTADDETVTQVAAAPVLAATKRDSLAVDADGNGIASPGDTLEYRVVIRNTGNSAATSVVFDDTPGANTTLVVGSVQTSQGTVTSGNTAGNTTVSVNIETIPGGGQAIVTFRVTVNNPLPAGVTQVANQGIVHSDQLPALPTDDPDTGTIGDPTATPVVAEPVLAATKRDTLAVDADGDGIASPGDTLEYRVVIQNSGNSAATGVRFDDIPDTNTTLVVGSVQTSAGTVTSGNAAGNTTVGVDIGTIPGGGQVVITFRVTINNPLPAGVTRVVNQGTIHSNELPSLPTDDPDTAAADDPTATPLTAAPVIDATKRDSLAVDADGNGQPSPGDTIEYRIVVANNGNQAGVATFVDNLLDTNAQLIVGSVQTSQGTVTTGNTAGDTSVVVSLGTIPGGSSASITFRVTIRNPLPAGVTQVENQAIVTGNNFPDVPTDDPDTPAADDPTITPLVAESVLVATKRDSLAVDADGDGIASPGDTLEYRVVIRNTGNSAATGVLFDDTPGANTTLVVGSVQTSVGTVTTGNAAGNTTVSVNIGTIPGGGQVVITFRVTIASPLPAGVTRVVNQGTIHSNELPSLPTDDPDTAQADDPTATPLTAAPIIDATKRDALAVDADGNGQPSPGDTIEYRIVVANNGNQAGVATFVDDLLDKNVALVVGSVQTSQGTVTRGNTAGDIGVTVSLGTVPGGQSATITFRVTINNPLPAGVTRITNQAVVTGDNFPNVPTDDPDTPAVDDPTVTPVVAEPVVEATKRDSLAVDADGNGIASPGDTLEYRVIIHNTGNSATTGVVFNDIPDANTALVVGSVQTSAGTVTVGNAAGNTSVSVNIGTIPGGGQVVITFQVTVNNPLPAGVTQVVNQGTVSSNELPTVPTDDPDTNAVNDPTVTPLTAAPILTASKRDSLAVDTDSNGVASPGDTLEYRVVIQNRGNSAASGVVFNDTPDANTALVVGSVQTSIGTVTAGNGAGDTTVSVDIGTIPGGGQVVITFRVTIANPLPAGVLSIANQGTVGSNELPAVPTDDPDTGAADDPTETQLAAAPVLEADKRDSLFTDADGDGTVSPGDTLLYETVVRNTGNAAASGVVFVDFPDPNTTLVVGSVQSSQGTVVTGNNAGDGGVRVEIGTIVGGGQVVITFRVTVNNPLPANVSRVVNQGTVTSNELPAVATNDPDTAAIDDPTVTPINAAPRLSLTKTDSLFTDVDGNGQPSPGDVLQYRLVVRNTGNQAAVNVIIQDAPDPFTRLVVGSVQTTAGTVTTGNTAGDASVVVAVGTIPGGGGQAVITYRVTIVNPVPATVEQVANQALAGADNAGGVSSDDPDTPTLGDPTLTPVVAEPLLDVSKRDSLLIDTNDDGLAGPGDTLIYQITILNVGNRAAANLVFNDTPDPNTALVVGTVQTNRGTVVSGNNPGNTVVRVDIGTLPGGGARADISFQVRITDTLPATVQQIANQGVVTGDNVAPAPSDDPDTTTDNDPTRTPVVGDPLVSATKQDSLLIDADGNGAVTAGDTLLYQVVINNSGNRAAAGVVYTDTPDVNTTIVPGSVQTSIGTVTTGNAAGDRTIRVDVGELPARYEVTISYQVKVNDPVPAGVKEIRNQGTVTGTDIADVTTDDPASPDPLDPTGTTLGEARLGLTKQAQPPLGTSLFPGDRITYTLRLANLGTIPVTNAVITDSIPLGTVYVTGTAQPAPTSGPNPLIWQIAQLAIGEAVTVSFSVEVLPVGQVTAIVNVGLAESDQTPVTTSPFVVLPFDPTDIDLLSFTATPEGSGLRVDWVTGAEIDTWGFHLWRSDSADRTQAVRMTSQLIPAKGRNGGGSAYSFLDTEVTADVLYWYWLEEVETDGSRNEYGPVSGSLPGPGSGVDGNHSLFLPLLGQGQATELTAPTEPPPTEAEPPAETDPPAETEGSEQILLPLVNR